MISILIDVSVVCKIVSIGHNCYQMGNVPYFKDNVKELTKPQGNVINVMMGTLT